MNVADPVALPSTSLRMDTRAPFLSWIGDPDLPDGVLHTPRLSQDAFVGVYASLVGAARHDALLPSLEALERLALPAQVGMPVSLVVLDVPLLCAAPADAIAMVHAPLEAEGDLRSEALLANATATRVFAASALMQSQWGVPSPAALGRDFAVRLSRAGWMGFAGERLPSRLLLDCHDGRGAIAIEFDQAHQVVCAADVTEMHCSLTAIWEEPGRDAQQRVARFLIPVGGTPTPLPDEEWPLDVTVDRYGRLTGRAAVYRTTQAERPAQRTPILLCEGFPGGYNAGYMYGLFDQHRLATRLRERGYDVIIVHLDQGASAIEANAQLLLQAMIRARSLTSAPLVVGGNSMGGLVARYALAWSETHGIDHGARILLTIDTPHDGAFTSPAAQYFASLFAPVSPLAARLHGALSSTANRQFVMQVLDDGSLDVAPERVRWQRALDDVGQWPQQVRRLGVASGHGNGLPQAPTGPLELLSAEGSPFFAMRLTSGHPDMADRTMMQGRCLATDNVTTSLPPDQVWEAMPGGQNVYLGMAAAIARSFRSGNVHCEHPVTCSVPTVSALAVQQDPALPIPPPSAGRSLMHDYVCNEQNAFHCAITPAVADWILDRLGPTDSPASDH